MLKALCFIICAAHAQGQSPLFDEQNAQAATKEISALDVEELRALSKVLVDCALRANDIDKPDVTCEKSIALYEIEYGRQRSLDVLLNAAAEFYLSLRVKKIQNEPGRLRAIYHLEKVNASLQQAVRAMFSELRKK
jgi:hypothetical protein